MQRLSLGFLVSGAFFLISVAWLGYTNTMPFSSSVTSFGGPGTFPFIVLSIMAVGSAAVTVGEFLKMRRERSGSLASPGGFVRVASLLLVAVAYVTVIEFVSYIPATVFLILSALLLFGVRNTIVLASVSLVFPVTVYLLFQLLLQVQLP